MLEDGRILGNYRIDGVLGRGGMGVVYEATQIPLQRTVALKILGSEVSADQAFRERFRHEGRIQATLDHPHIVTVFEAGELEGHLFIAMRLVRGPTLAGLILGAIKPERALRILARVADALDAAHDAGLIHRDIKPQNILVGPRDHPYLADFGLTKTTATPALTHTGEFVGTIHYSAPEQIRGETLSARTDVYALGAVLFEALTGRVPYPRDNDVAVLYAHMFEEPPRVSAHRPDLPPDLDRVIASAMAKAPQDRPASAAALLRGAELAFRRDPHHSSGRAAEAAPSPPRLDGPAAAGPTKPAGSPTVVGRAAARSLRPIAWIAAAPVLLALGVAGYAAGRSESSGKAKRTRPAVATAAGIKLDVPAGWARTHPPELAGLKFANALAIAPAGQSGEGLVAGLVADATGPDLLPASVTRRLDDPPAAGTLVDLAGLQALRYRRLRVDGSDRLVTLYAVPTARGSITIACYAPSAGPPPTAQDDCESAATTLRVTGTRTYDVAIDRGYGAGLRRVLNRLDRDRRKLRATLRAARLPAMQSACTRRLASVTGRAAREARALVVSARDRESHERLLRGLVAAREGYERMSAAARDGGRTRFRRASGSVRRGEAVVRAAVASLRPLGYTS